MAVSRDSNVIRMTADDDTVTMGQGGFHIVAVRLVGGSDAATALIKETNTSGTVLFSLKTAAANGVDSFEACVRVEASTLHLDLTGTGAEVFIYLK